MGRLGVDMVYNSKWNKEEPVAPQMEGLDEDIVDEAIDKFKANVMFKSFKPEGPADLTHLYLLLFIHQCIQRLEKCENKRKGQEALNELLSNSVAVPFDSSFPVSALYTQDNAQRGDTVKYFGQLRKQVTVRLVDLVFPVETEPGSKWWLCFAKRSFLKKPLK